MGGTDVGYMEGSLTWADQSGERRCKKIFPSLTLRTMAKLQRSLKRNVF
jgi:hypothetical protein